jgi:hypothetical protein
MDPVLTVQVKGSDLVTRYPSAVDGRPCEDSIRLEDVVRVTLERVAEVVHWYFQHQEGWTLHFHDGFDGAPAAIAWLERSLGFSTPAEIAGAGGDGTTAWARS